jgi:hypothetical protein
MFSSDFVQVVHQRNKFMGVRDVAGQLALGPSSDVASAHTVQLKVDLPESASTVRAYPRWSVHLDPELPTVEPDDAEISASIDNSISSWKFTAALLVHSREIYKRIHITLAPQVQDILIQRADQSFFLNRLIPRWMNHHVAADGRLFIPCSGRTAPARTESLRQLAIRIGAEGTRAIDILAHALNYKGLVNAESLIRENGERMCPTRLVFNSDTVGWIFGIPLIASVQYVLLDSENSQIVFRVGPVDSQRHLSVVSASEPMLDAPYIPLFGIPEVMEAGEGAKRKISIQFSTGWESVSGGQSDNLLLYKTAADLNEETKEMMFTFIKKPQGLLKPEPREPLRTVLDGVFQTPFIGCQTLSTSGGHIARFNFVAASDPDSTSYELSIVSSRFYLQIVTKKIETFIDIGHYVLPSVADVLPESECGVCRDLIEESTNVVSLPCGTVFHKDCLERWLGTNRSCPHCRTSVELKEGPLMLRRVTTPEP